MNATLERIRAEVRTLPPDERELLLAALDYDFSTGDSATEDEVEAAWERELEGRISAVRLGKVELVSTESVDLAMDAVFARHGIERTQRFK